jgi:iron(III) transport system permease protein
MVVKGGFIVDGNSRWHICTACFSTRCTLEGLFNSLHACHRHHHAGDVHRGPLVLVPMILPPFVGAIGFQQILGQYGGLNALLWARAGRLAGEAAILGRDQPAVAFRSIRSCTSTPRPRWPTSTTRWTRPPKISAARLDRKFRRITLPLITPGLFRRRHHRLHLELHRTGHAADHELHEMRLGAGLRRAQGNRLQSLPLRAGVRDAHVSVALYALSKWLFGGKAYAMQSKAATTFATPASGAGRAAW